MSQGKLMEIEWGHKPWCSNLNLAQPFLQFGKQHKRVQQRQRGAHEAGEEQSVYILCFSFKVSKHGEMFSLLLPTIHAQI